MVYPFHDRPDVGFPIVIYPVPDNREPIPPGLFWERHYEIEDGWQLIHPCIHRPGEWHHAPAKPEDQGLRPLVGTPDQWWNGFSYETYLAGGYPLAKLDDHWQCEVSKVAFSGAKVIRTANQIVGNNEFLVLGWSEIQYDTDGYWSDSEPGRFTIPEGMGGVFSVVAYIPWGASFDPRQLVVQLRVNGTDLVGEQGTQLHGADGEAFNWGNVPGPATAPATVPLEDGDWVEVRIGQRNAITDSEEDFTLGSSATRRPSFAITRLGDLPEE